ncbi:MAG: hypothetical protein LBD22_07230, partial [Spirochaetaceae bacterium]|nr:hypothetical protein [Spirochaetaceae bacterium]
MSFNPRIALIAASAAFVASCALSLICKTMLGFALLRAMLFAALFFILTAFAGVIFENFLFVNRDDDYGGADPDYGGLPDLPGDEGAVESLTGGTAAEPAGAAPEEAPGQSVPDTLTLSSGLEYSSAEPGTSTNGMAGSPSTAATASSLRGEGDTLYKNNDSPYTLDKGVRMPSEGDDAFSLNVNDFVPGLSGNEEQTGNSKPERFEMETVE